MPVSGGRLLHANEKEDNGRDWGRNQKGNGTTRGVSKSWVGGGKKKGEKKAAERLDTKEKAGVLGAERDKQKENYGKDGEKKGNVASRSRGNLT